MAKSKPAKVAPAAEPGAKEKVCPVSKEEFLEHAQPFTVQIGGTSLVATPREFSSGGYGYFVNDRVDVIINGKKCKMMTVLNMPLVYSKPRGD